MMATAYKYLDIGINVGPYVLCGNVPCNNNNKDNHIILPCTTCCKAFHREKRADIEQLVQSTALSPLSIQDLIVELVKICDTNIVKLVSHDTCIYVHETRDHIIFI